MKVFKTFIKPFEAQQRSVKTKIKLFFFSLRPGLGREGLNEPFYYSIKHTSTFQDIFQLDMLNDFLFFYHTIESFSVQTKVTVKKNNRMGPWSSSNNTSLEEKFRKKL